MSDASVPRHLAVTSDHRAVRGCDDVWGRAGEDVWGRAGESVCARTRNTEEGVWSRDSPVSPFSRCLSQSDWLSDWNEIENFHPSLVALECD